MYIAVFLTRYLDLLWVSPLASLWNFFLKIFYITTSIYIIALMTRVYARTRERERAWKLAAYIAGGALVAAPLVDLIFGGTSRIGWFETTWTFSVILEAFCVLPQLILLRQTTVPTVIDSFYLVTLGSYRAFYILNWIYRAAHKDFPDPVKVIFGIIQTAFYIDFAWVYWTRQRVKLRGGGVVDSDDLRKGFLVNRFIDHRTSIGDEETDPEQTGGRGATNKPVNRWGNRGVSVSADDTLDHADQTRVSKNAAHGNSDQGRPDTDASHEEDIFLSDEDEDAPALSGADSDILNGWRDSTPGR